MSQSRQTGFFSDENKPEDMLQERTESAPIAKGWSQWDQARTNLK